MSVEYVMDRELYMSVDVRLYQKVIVTVTETSSMSVVCGGAGLYSDCDADGSMECGDVVDPWYSRRRL